MSSPIRKESLLIVQGGRTLSWPNKQHIEWVVLSIGSDASVDVLEPPSMSSQHFGCPGGGCQSWLAHAIPSVSSLGKSD